MRGSTTRSHPARSPLQSPFPSLPVHSRPNEEGAPGTRNTLCLAGGSPSATGSSACEPHRAWIESQLQLGRNAQSLYQDLVEQHGFAHRYNSVKRFVAKLKARSPERFDVLEFLPGEEAQVDYGQGAPA